MENATDQANRVEGYASALLNIANTEGEDVTDEIFRAAEALNGNAELIDTLSDSRIPADRKQGIVDDLLGSHASRVTVAAINFVVGAGQARHLGDIATKLAELAAEAEGEVVAEVRAPLDLDPDQIQRLTAALSRATGKRVQVKVIVDPSVIGGVVAKVGDTVLDGSVQNRFTELREQWG
ncbi:MAG: F0F1 ATP synthase subunit delta [Acidimicrobiia bacterium]|nr:MAG: F0F1 ATP synthase subunit delta [Acidimicrobiia bacterium]